jgi:signal transduction histidine kinase
MRVYEIPNRLKLEERLEVPRLISHDVMGLVLALGNTAGMEEREEGYAENSKGIMAHLSCILDAVSVLTRDSFLVYERDPSYIEIALNQLPYGLIRGTPNVSTDVSLNYSIFTEDSVLFAALANLAKNSHEAQNGTSITVSASSFSGDIPNLAFSPEGASTSRDYVRFAVSDDGPGFPKDKPLPDYLETGVSTKGSGGFGMFMAKLASIALNAPISIESKPGDTTVALYHPMDLR